jgi:hypothetical protein
MLDADRDLRRLPGADRPEVAAALDRRRASLGRALQFDAMVLALKTRRFGRALRQAAAAPGAALLLTLPLRDRLRGLGRAKAPPPAASGRPLVCVLARGEALPLRRALEADGFATHLLRAPPGPPDRAACLSIARAAPQAARAVVAEPGLAWAIPYAPRPGLPALVVQDAAQGLHDLAGWLDAAGQAGAP